ncbi:MAG: tol-pal system protein YbgF [Desulfobacteraceae bacterium]|nr:MAG: tol-pal system protein YbgF [Desulfobacteraceae bacterium]
MKAVKALAVFAFSGLVFIHGCVSSDEMSVLRNRIEGLEQQLASQDAQLSSTASELKSKLGQRTQADEKIRSQSAELYATIDQIREDLSSLRGRVEEAEYLLKNQQNNQQQAGGEQVQQLEKIAETAGRNEGRIRRIEQYLNIEASAKPAADAAGKPHDESEDAAYNAAKEAFERGEFPQAREKFEGFLKKYPKSPIADNAQFWIGETYYREKWYEKAILEYQKVIESYPKGNKVQSSLLKQGLSFQNLGDKASARLILSELMKKYPQSSEAKIASQKLKEIK